MPSSRRIGGVVLDWVLSMQWWPLAAGSSKDIFHAKFRFWRGTSLIVIKVVEEFGPAEPLQNLKEENKEVF